MKRAYIFGGLLLLAGIIVSVVGLIVTGVSIPDVDVSNLHLEGWLVLAHESEGVSILDLTSGESQTVFVPDERGLLTGAALSPDETTLALAYAPSPEGLIQSGSANLYVLPADGSGAPEMLVDGSGQDAISGPVWSPDGESIFYVRSQAGGVSAHSSIERIAYLAGEPETMVEGGFAPDLSPDGSRLAYLAASLGSSFDGVFVANSDGTQPIELVGGESFVTIERLSLSPDGTTLAFSAEENPLASKHTGGQTLQALFGVSIARAHDEASITDIWAISTAGGSPYRVAKLSAEGIVLDYSPDGQHIAFVSAEGLYIMGSDGSGLSRIGEQHLLRSVQWVP